MATHAHSPKHFNEADPHGFDKGHDHGHVIVGPVLLRTILAFLLFFTALTVGLAQVEVWVQNEFDFVLPGWVNIAIAMSIATVKSLLVMAYFMQLRYDNPINTILMCFCFFALFLFIFFTALDLTGRGWIYTKELYGFNKIEYVQEGGTGSGVATALENRNVVGSARLRFEQRLGAPEYAELRLSTMAAFARAEALRTSGGEANEQAAREIETLTTKFFKANAPVGKSTPADARARFAALLNSRAEALSGAVATEVSSLATAIETLRLDLSKMPPIEAEVEYVHSIKAGHGHGHDESHESTGSSADRSRPVSGLTGALEAHGGEHGSGAGHHE